MRARFMPWLSALALLVGISACGGSPLPSPAASAQQVLPLWHTLSDSRERALLALVDQWNATNPAGAVLVPERKDPAQIRKGVTDALARGAMPPLMLLPTALAASFQRKDLLTDLRPFVASSEDGVGISEPSKADLFPFALSAGRSSDGGLWGIPQGGSVRAMIYNRDWLTSLNLQAAPQDWELFKLACGRAADSRRGTACFPIYSSAGSFADWVLSVGARLTSPDGARWTLNTPQVTDAMDRLVQLQRANHFLRIGSDTQAHAEFGAGRSLFGFEWTDHLADIQSGVRNGADFEWSVSPIPGLTGSGASMYRGPLWVITRVAPDRAKAAWQFVRWMSEPAQTARWAELTGDIPIRASAVMSDAPRAQAIRDIAAKAVPEPFVSGLECAGAAMEAAFSHILDGDSISDSLRQAESQAQKDSTSYCGK